MLVNPLWSIKRVGLNDLSVLLFKTVSKLPSFKITDSNTFVTIHGVRGVIIHDINEELKKLDKLVDGSQYQIFDAERIAGAAHIYHAAANAEYALKNGLNLSKSITVETLLYAACENQISKAIKFLGVSPETRTATIAVFSDVEDDPAAMKISENLGKLDDSVLGITPEKYELLKNLYGVTETAIETIGQDRYDALLWLISEKGALIGLGR